MPDDLIHVAGNCLILPPQKADRNPAAAYIMSLNSPGSRRTMLEALNAIARWLNPASNAMSFRWAALRRTHVLAIRAHLAEHYAPASANKMLCALRRTLKECRRLHQMSAEDYEEVIDIASIKAETLLAGRALSAPEIAALLAACDADPTPAGIRDGALIAVLLGTAIRRAEACGLDLEDFHPETGELCVRHAKRSKQRIVYAVNGAGDSLNDWLEVRGQEPGALFCPVRKDGKIEIRRLSTQAIYAVTQKRAGEAGLKHLSPLDLRRSSLTNLLSAGIDAITVSRLAGHAGVDTTKRYDRRPEKVKRKAALKLHIPYRKRNSSLD